MDVKTMGVVGAGQMGSGIAQVAAMSGLQIVMSDINEDLVRKGVQTIARILNRSVEKGKMSPEDKEEVLGRIKTTVDNKDLSAADLVVEAATENEAVKFKIFRNLDEICGPEAILATNTSSIPIGRIAAQTKRPEKVIGMHFMNPVPVMKLVEVIPGLATSDHTFETVWDLTVKFGKTPVKAMDYPAFIANRILMPMINEAIYCLYHGVGTREDIDTVMKLGMNHPMALQTSLVWTPALLSWKPCTMVSLIPNTGHVLCCAGTWKQVGWDAKQAGVSINTINYHS